MAPLARPGATCWRIARASRVALLVDNQSYFAALLAALEDARRSVWIVGWHFDPRTGLAADGAPARPQGRIGDVLRALAKRQPALDIRVLIWDMALPIAATRALFPQRAKQWFDGRVCFRLDECHPPGACHHQKVVVIDEALAFVSGGDLSGDRWDTPAHLDRDPRRRLPSGKPHPARHEVTMAVEGEAAVALADLARTRWARAGGEDGSPPGAPGPAPWPDELACDLADVPVAIARTEPPFAGRPGVTEVEALYLAGIAAARRVIYLENQYFASPRIAEALAARLAERHGPRVVLVLAAHSPSWFDRMTMDTPRDLLLERLAAADRHARLHACTPATPAGHDVVVHSKLMIVDDRLLRVGSANLNNRSMGLDTECDLAIDAALCGERRQEVTAVIARFRERLLAHHRLEPLRPAAMGALRRFIARYHLGDPCSPGDVLRPWRRFNRAWAHASAGRLPCGRRA